MFFEILLLSVVVATAYLGPMVLRRSPPGQRTYGWMLIADLGLAIVGFAARRSGEPDRTADLIGVVAIGGAICLVLVPPVLRDLARRALLRDRLRMALFFIDLRELLQPGMGARQERELIEAILAVRSGKVEAAVEVLEEARNGIEDPLARRQIDERIVMTYLYARRWDDAIGRFERALDGQPGPTSPQLLVEMVRAYCEAGELQKAAKLVEGLEESPLAREPMLAFLLNRSRLVFLAFVGRTSAVDAIVAPTGPLGGMPEAAREFWSGVARLNAGDRTGARSSLEQAARLSGRDRRARELAEETLLSLDQPGVVGPRTVPPLVAELADRLTTLAQREKSTPRTKPPPKLAGVGWRKVPVSVGLVAANVLIAVIVTMTFRSSGDVGGLIRAGANLKSAVAVGEWWRLPASMFLHVGVLHLALNMYGLWILGRLVEQMFGSVRFYALYMLAGLIGAGASYYFGSPGLSAGASGAVFGVLGAAVAELALHREAYPERWRRALLGNLVFLIIANVAIGFYYQEIDQSAHMGGLVAGAVVALLLSPKASWASASATRVAVLGLALLGGIATAYGVGGAVTTDYADTLSKYPLVERELEGVALKVPSDWNVEDGRLVDSSGVINFWVGLAEAQKLGDELTALLSEAEVAASGQFDTSRRATQNLVTLPDGWRSRELAVSADSTGGKQLFRVVVFGKEDDRGVWVGRFLVPEALARDASFAVSEALRTARPVPRVDSK